MGRIYGVSVLRTELSNWNNGFDGRARRDSEGQIFATDKARKYSLRQDLINAGEKVLIVSEKEVSSGKYMSLEAKLKKEFQGNFTIKDIFETFIDVRLFGAVIAVKKNNFGLTGPTQILFAKDQHVNENNEYQGEELYLDITSYLPGKSGDQTTIGKMNVLEKAYYAYPFLVDFNIYSKNCVETGLFAADQEEEIRALYNRDVQTLKEALSYDVTNLNSCFKMGSTNFFNIIVETETDLDTLDLAAFQYQVYIKEQENIEEGNSEITINLKNIVNELISKDSKIKSVELTLPNKVKFNLTIEGLTDLEEKMKDKITKRYI